MPQSTQLISSVDHGFEIDSFFEPHVEAWLRETEASKVHEWVSRAVAMDNVSSSYQISCGSLTSQWKPEGDQNYSQSVVDLFEFIQQSMQVILEGLPLSPLKRAIYLTDMSKVSHTIYSADIRQLQWRFRSTRIRSTLFSKLI